MIQNGSEERLPPDVMGHMAGLGGHSSDLGVCNTHLRSLNYGYMLKAAASLALIQEAITELTPLAALLPGVNGAVAKLIVAKNESQQALKYTIELVIGDLDVQIDPEYWDTPEEKLMAAEAFYRSRTEEFVDMDSGELKAMPHDEGVDHS